MTQAGTYPLRLHARHAGDPAHYTTFATLDFVVILVDPCIEAELTINPAILTTTSIKYYLSEVWLLENFSDSLVTSTETQATCPDITFEVVNQADGS